MNGYFSEAGIFLISVIFGFLILAVMLRLLLQWVRADFYNPISQFLVKITDPLLKPLRRIIPGVAGIDMASVVLLVLLQVIELLLSYAIGGVPLHPWVILIMAITGLLKTLLYIFIVGIIILAIASWIAPGAYNPVLNLINQITAPVVHPIQKRMKPISGLDLSPLVALLVLNLLLMAIPHLQRSLLGLLV